MFGLKKKVKIVLFEGGKIPAYKTSGAACADCYANETKIIHPGERDLVKLGFAIEIPYGYEGKIRPRSGNSRVAIDTAEGTIDPDYRGEVSANVVNESHSDFIIHAGDRICQLKIQKAEQWNFKVVDKLTSTDRGSGGFGHTGMRM